MKQRVMAVVTAGVVAVSLGACAASDDSGGGGSGSGDGPVTIGAALDMTAYLASFDRGVRDGVELGAKSVNADGGVLGGRDLKVEVDDMKADPQQGVRAVQKLIDQNSAAAFANGFSSAATQAEAPQAERYKKPMIVASVLPDAPTWQFSTVPAPTFETGIRMQYVQQQGITSIAVLMDATPYDQKQLAALKEQAKADGVKITGVVEHKSDAVDLRPQVTNLLRGNPGAIVKLSAGPTHIVAAKALSSAGSKIPLLLGIEALDTMKQASAAYANTLFAAAPPQVYEAIPADQRADALTALVKAAPKGQDLTYVGRGYDAIELLAQAIDKAGSTDGDKVRQALIDLGPYEGTSGTYDFTDDNHYGLTKNPLYLAQIKDGAVTIVLSPEDQ
jgi:branched-chain amino acid transport system substrate-binding protein